MKRIAIMVILVLLVFCSSSAEGLIDFSAFTDSDILEIQQEVNNELSSRGILDDIIYQGKYIVGEDIRSGNLVFTYVANENSTNKVTIFVKTGKNGQNICREILYPGCSCQIKVNDGELIEICDGSLIVTFRDSKPSWAP